MSEAMYNKTEVVGVSGNSFSDAVANAIAKCGRTIEDLRWFEVVEQRGSIVDGKIHEYQVTVKVCSRAQ